MAGSVKQKKIDELAEKVRESLSHNAWFEAERLCIKGLAMARQEQDFQRMAQLIPPLLEARQQRVRSALANGKIKILQTPITEDMKITRGCYLVQPPNVGSDARRLRLAALNAEIPVVVLCREPLSAAKLVPIVAISPGATLRVKVTPPQNPEKPDLAWFIAAIQELGDYALESLDPTLPITRRIDALLEHLDALPEHDELHLALEAACREAAAGMSGSKNADAPAKPVSKAKIKS